jgi:hypothetical protein
MRLALVFFTMMAVIVLIVAVNDQGWAHGLAAAFWTAMAWFSCHALKPDGSCLDLTPEGFTERQFFLAATRRWRDVESFFVVKHAEGSAVGFRYVADYPRSAWTKLLEKANGYSSCLMTTYGSTPDELAALLNTWRERFHSTPPAKAELIDDRL